MIVVDPPVLVTLIADDTDIGVRFAAEMSGEEAAAAHLVDCEVVSATKRLRIRAAFPKSTHLRPSPTCTAFRSSGFHTVPSSTACGNSARRSPHMT